MADISPDLLAEECKRLKRDEVLKLILNNVRSDTLESLSAAQPDDTVRIIQLQSIVTAIDEIYRHMDAAVERAAL